MCGLAFAATKKGKPVGQRVWSLYSKQKSRGQKGFGYIAINDGKLVNLVRGRDEIDIKDKLLKEKSQIVMLHHRFPTSTDNTLGTTHPIFVSNDELEYDYLVMHNGVVSNDDELKKKHNELGYVYTTEFVEKTYAFHANGANEILSMGKTAYNDSEALAIEMARYLDGKDEKTHFTGAAAIMGVQMKKGTNDVVDVFYGQNHGRQLGRQDKKGWTLIASEHGKEVPQMMLYHFNPHTFETESTALDIDEAKPTPSTYNYYNGWDDTYRRTKTMGFKDKNPHNLVNAVYTYQEAIDSGAPLSEFTSHGTIYNDDHGYTASYVPNIFSGKEYLNRPRFADAFYYPEEDDIQMLPEPENQLAELEELAMQYARKQYESNKIVDLHERGWMSDDIYNTRYNNIECSLNELQNKMDALGHDGAEVESHIDLAMELVDYEYTGRKHNVS